MKYFLDTSAWVKRYLIEEGTPEVDRIFDSIVLGGGKLLSSIWNIGECVGVFDKRRQREDIDQTEFEMVLEKFFKETLDLVDRGNMELLPISGGFLTESWEIILESRIYQADALQIVALGERSPDVFLTADDRLARVARKRGFKAIDLEREEEREKLRKLI